MSYILTNRDIDLLDCTTAIHIMEKPLLCKFYEVYIHAWYICMRGDSCSLKIETLKHHATELKQMRHLCNAQYMVKVRILQPFYHAGAGKVYMYMCKSRQVQLISVTLSSIWQSMCQLHFRTLSIGLIYCNSGNFRCIVIIHGYAKQRTGSDCQPRKLETVN